LAGQAVKLIRHKRKRSGILVPLLEDLFQAPVEIETDEDVEWIAGLLRKMAGRTQARNSRPVFSPSQLSECLRYVYLLKHHKEMGIVRAKSVRVEPNFYFFNGNFVHIKWQFALYKLDLSLPDEIFKLIGVEVPIISKRKDHGGTVDAIVLIRGKLYIIDFKGLNVRTFGEITRGYIPPEYAVQLADYGMLYNSQRNGDGQIFTGLLVSESKGGPDNKHLIALHETEIAVKTHLPEVRRRLKELREHGEANTIPPPECEGTGTLQFLGCPFRKFCRSEVREIQRNKAKAEAKKDSSYSVRRSGRVRRSRS
jgi:hypothetical protein